MKLYLVNAKIPLGILFELFFKTNYEHNISVETQI